MLWKKFVEPNRPQMAIWRMVHCMLDTYGYKHKFSACNNYCFFYCNNRCTNSPQCHGICALPLFLFTRWAKLDPVLNAQL